MSEANPGFRILVVDDEEDMLRICTNVLRSGLTSPAGQPHVETTSSALEARQLLMQGAFDLVVLDVKMPGVSGLELMHFALEHGHGSSLVLITAFPTYGDAVTATKEGAFDYVTKPFTADELLDVARRALEDRLARKASQCGTGAEGGPLGALLGESGLLRELRRLVARVSPLRENVLLLGETGTGKNLVAHTLHVNGPLRERPMITLDCGAIPAELMESELFGHEKGSFTGAVQTRKGLLELAEEGTLLLDEISDLPLRLQSRLLRALQEKEFRRVGGSVVRHFGARVIAASNVDLQREVREGRFREDLYFRLNVIPITLPPLRARPEDAQVLGRAFLRRFRDRNPECDVQDISRGALRVLARYAWPGNVRELENVIRRTAAFCSGREITVDDLPEEIPRDPRGEEEVDADFFSARRQWLSGFEERYFRDLLQQTAGNVVEAARLSGVPRASLYRYLRKYGLDPAHFRGSNAGQGSRQ